MLEHRRQQFKYFTEMLSLGSHPCIQYNVSYTAAGIKGNINVYGRTEVIVCFYHILLLKFPVYGLYDFT